MLTRLLVIITLLCGYAFAQDPASQTPYQVIDGRTGVALPCVGCSIYTYSAGTNSLLATYSDYTLGTPNTNPVLTNSAGYAAGGDGSTITGIWVGASCYKFKLNDSLGQTIWTQDHVCDQSQVFKVLLSGPTGSAQIGYKYSSSATARTVQSRLQDAASINDFGADPAGILDSTTAINTALASSTFVSARCGTYLIASTVSIPVGVNVMFPIGCVTLNYSGSGTAVSGTDLESQYVEMNVHKVSSTWPTDTTSIGFLIMGANKARFVPVASGFHEGYQGNGTVGNFSNSQFLAGTSLQDNMIGFHARGVFTSNQLYSPSVRISSGAGCTSPPIAGTKYIWMDATTDVSGDINQIDIYSPELQNSCPQYSLYIDGASATQIRVHSPRFEANVDGAVTMTATTKENLIEDPFIDSGRCTGNEIVDLSNQQNNVRLSGVCDRGPMSIVGSQDYLNKVNATGVLQWREKQGDSYHAGTVTAMGGFPIPLATPLNLTLTCGAGAAPGLGTGLAYGSITAGTGTPGVCKFDLPSGPSAPNTLICQGSFIIPGPTYEPAVFDLPGSGPTTAVFRRTSGTIPSGAILSFSCGAI